MLAIVERGEFETVAHLGDTDHDSDTDSGPAWRLARLSQLSSAELYEIMALRQRVFVVEQGITYLDADGLDLAALHLLGRTPEGLTAYARLIPPLDGGAVRVGRVAVAREARGQGFGRAVVAQALACAAELAPGLPVMIAAQVHLQDFYESFGFAVTSEAYDDHGVLHVDMMLGGFFEEEDMPAEAAAEEAEAPEAAVEAADGEPAQAETADNEPAAPELENAGA